MPTRVGPIPVIGSGDAVSGVCSDNCAYHGVCVAPPCMQRPVASVVNVAE